MKEITVQISIESSRNDNFDKTKLCAKGTGRQSEHSWRWSYFGTSECIYFFSSIVLLKFVCCYTYLKCGVFDTVKWNKWKSWRIMHCHAYMHAQNSNNIRQDQMKWKTHSTTKNYWYVSCALKTRRFWRNYRKVNGISIVVSHCIISKNHKP